MVGLFVGSVLASLQESVLAATDDGDSDDGEDEEDDSVEIVGEDDEVVLPRPKPRQTSALANAVKSMDQTPMMSVINILNSLRGSLPAGKRWMLDKIVRQLSMSKEGDLYTPYSIAKQGGTFWFVASLSSAHHV
jgi:hypothetical protein